MVDADGTDPGDAVHSLGVTDIMEPAAIVDSSGILIGWSQAAERMSGYRATDVVKRSVVSLLSPSSDGFGFSPPDSTRPSGSWPGVLTARKAASGQVAVRHRDGRILRVSVRVTPLTGGDGRTDWLIAAADISTSTSGITSRDHSGSTSGSASRSPSPTTSSDAYHSSTGFVSNESSLSALLKRVPLGMAIWDLDLRCTWLNDTVDGLNGALPHQRLHLGRRVTDSLSGFDTDAVAAVMTRVLADGHPVIDREFRWVSVDAQDDLVFSVSFFRLDGADGEPLGVCSVSMDISNSWARKRLAVLSDASARIGSTLDVMSTAQELADVAVPLLADFVTVDLAETVRLGEERLERLERLEPDATGIPLFRRAGVASVRPDGSAFLWPRGETVFVAPRSPFAVVLESGRSHFEPILESSVDTWLGHDPERARDIRETGIHSMMIIPVKARGMVLGVAVFIRTETSVPFSRDDLLLAEELVARAALSLDNARRYTRERTAALALQRHLLPRKLSGGSAVDVASRYLPTDLQDGVGGDWFDVIPLSGARVALVVGDVVGHGINAAATMGRLRTAVHTLADMELAPDELLARLDDLVVRLTQSSAGPDGHLSSVMEATCLYVVYDPVTRTCTMSRAGHPPPAIVGPDGSVTFPDLPLGTPIGLGLTTFESVEMTLPEGSVIALYTDGLVETRASDIDDGLDRLATTLTQHGTSDDLEELCAGVIDTMAAKAPAEDDIALLVARTRILASDQVATWELPTDPTVVRIARSLTARQLSSWGLDQVAATLELVVSELVTNAIRYGAAPIRLRLIRHSTLICEVSDADNSAPRLRHPRTTDENGRGLLLVAKLSHRWGNRFTAEGKIVWAELDIP